MFKLKVVTPDKTFFDKEAEMVIFKTTVGDRAVLKGHIPIVAGVKEGKLKIKIDGKFKLASIGNGFVTVDGKTDTVLVTEKAVWNDQEEK
ncbi:FoF1 ATP synthase subunit delta/epsilon [Peptostreptococcus faecalis]|uniref:FoF1 ATP synthase subunit delta/epsilon n=1 Tax=Peptostreptococcus faecalis TaxID=2045015 RepID=UPI000C7D3487|nr:F0F1 ATP synthase subunit epsilon [Peptostreptococcus faecalis]